VTGRQATGRQATGRQATGRQATGRQATGRQATRQATRGQATPRLGESANMTILGYSWAFNHHRKFINKKDDIEKISKDINVGESVSINVAPRYFYKR
jgi:hypothetical protein